MEFSHVFVPEEDKLATTMCFREALETKLEIYVIANAISGLVVIIDQMKGPIKLSSICLSVSLTRFVAEFGFFQVHSLNQKVFHL